MSRWNDLLPKFVEIGGAPYDIRSDYRDIREIMIAMNDKELTEAERIEVALTIFYPNASEIPPEHIQEALDRLSWFINCGKPESGQRKKIPKLIDWEKDFSVIVSPINKIIGTEVRALEYLHWWTYKAAWDEIPPDCTWAQVVRIRNKRARNKPLDKSEAQWYRENRDLVEIAPTYTAEELAFLLQYGGRKEEGDDGKA